MALQTIIDCDVLVIGGGIAGCFAAIKAREMGLDVLMVNKGYVGFSGSTPDALLGYMVCNPEWGIDIKACVETINQKGEYVNDREWTEIILRESLSTYQDLVAWGADFPIEDQADVKGVRGYAPFGIVRIAGSGTGMPCRRQAMKVGVRIMDRVMITDLLKADGQVVGAIGFPLEGLDTRIFRAKATVLATGFNSMTTGEGDGIAYRAGAELTTKEFAYTWPGAGAPIGGRRGIAACNVFLNFKDASGTQIDLHDKYELDLTMEFLIHAGKGPIYWDLGAATAKDIERMRKRQENAYPNERVDFDPSRGGQLQMGGANLHMLVASQTGGTWVVNTDCAATLPGLFVAGECCGTRYLGGYHPAPGFGLTGSAVTGGRAGRGAAAYARRANKVGLDEKEVAKAKSVMFAPVERKSGYSPRWVEQAVQNTMMPYYVKYIKHRDRLQAAMTMIAFIRDHLVPWVMAVDSHGLRLAHEAKSIALNAEMILRCSLLRTESRANHYREDFPRRNDDEWLAWTKFKQGEGGMELWKESVPREWWPDLSKAYEERYPRRFPGEWPGGD